MTVMKKLIRIVVSVDYFVRFQQIQIHKSSCSVLVSRTLNQHEDLVGVN